MNTKVIVVVALTLLVYGLPAYSQFVGPGKTTVSNVRSILANPVDDMWVTLKGHILEKTGRDKYTFSDGTGQIRLDIDEKYFPAGVVVTPETHIQISGEVDVEHYRSPELDVKNLVVLPAGGSDSPTPGRFESK